MKKLLAGILTVCGVLAFSIPTASAVPGGVAGSYYFTDIVTYLRGMPISAINIGGQTLISAEAMSRYGFNVTWHAEKRRLEIADNGTNEVTQDNWRIQDKAYGTPGLVAGRYYYTDIVTTLNGVEITSYNIGGQTYIAAESMSGFGYNVSWDGGERTLRIGTPSPVTISCTITSMEFREGALYLGTGGGSLTDDCTVKITVPASWEYSEDLNTTDYTPKAIDKLYGVRLYHYDDIYDMPEAMFAYNTRDVSYSEEMAEAVASSEHFALSGREVFVEHLDGAMLYDLDMFMHDYYIRVDDAHVLRVIMISPSMDGEYVRRSALDSIDFNYVVVEPSDPWDDYTYNYGLPDAYTLSNNEVLDADGQLVGLIHKGFYGGGYTSCEEAILDSTDTWYDTSEILSVRDNGNYILQCVTFAGNGLFGMSDLEAAKDDTTVYTVAVCDEAKYVVVMISILADGVSMETMETIAESASIS